MATLVSRRLVSPTTPCDTASNPNLLTRHPHHLIHCIHSGSLAKSKLMPLLYGCSKAINNNVNYRSAGAETEKKQQLSISSSSSSNSIRADDDDDGSEAVKSQSKLDEELLCDARAATQAGQQMSREQYAALRRKIGGTYRDFFKDSIDVDGEFVEDGWIDKTCKICKKDSSNAPRTIDKFGRYAHVECLESKRQMGNFFSRLFWS